jgi:YVTN family beta-propeller protein
MSLPDGADASNAERMKDVAGPGMIFELLALNRDIATPAKPKYFSPAAMAVSPDGNYMYIAGQTAKQVKVFDLKDKMTVNTILLPNEVTGLAASPEGLKLFVTCSSDQWPAGQVCEVDLSSGRVVAVIAAGHGARAPVITPDGGKLFVCNRYDNDVSVVNTATRSVTARIPVGREPYCAAITPDGKTVVVGNLLPADRSIDSMFISSVVSFIDATGDKASGSVRLTRGEYSIHGIAVSPDGRYAFATNLFSPFSLLASSVVGGHGGKNMLSIIDLTSKTLVNGVCLDRANKGMANPWDVQCSDDGAYLVVSHAGTNELTIINLPALLDTVAVKTKAEVSMRYNFNLINDIRASRATSSVGPRAIKLLGDAIYTTGYFDETPHVEQIPLSLKTTPVASVYPLDNRTLLSQQRKGEAWFYDATLCFQNWRSCHFCHMFTGTSGLYQILNSGVSAYPKNTKSLTYSWWTPPMDWSGKREAGDFKVRASIMLELFQTPADSVVNALDTFLMNIQPVASPILEKGQLSASAQRGKALFYHDKAGCTACHTPPLFCNEKLYEVNVGDPSWTDPVNTPSLVECWKSAPYGHLGNILTIREMMALPDHQPKTAITQQELIDLEQYILSL